MSETLDRYMHRCVDCGRWFSRLEGDEEPCFCGGVLVIDGRYHPDGVRAPVPDPVPKGANGKSNGNGHHPHGVNGHAYVVAPSTLPVPPLPCEFCGGDKTVLLASRKAGAERAFAHVLRVPCPVCSTT